MLVSQEESEGDVNVASSGEDGGIARVFSSS